MPNNYVLLERIELNASTTSVTFANIPQTGYTDLKIVVSARGSNTDGYSGPLWVRFNSNTANYSNRALFANDSTTASSGTNSYGITSAGYSGEVPGANLTASTFSNTEIYVPNYNGSSNKSFSVDGTSENNAATIYTFSLALNANLWTNTSAINSVTLLLGNTVGNVNFVQYSTFSLYGLAATGTTPVIAPKASGGNIIDYDGTYWIHTFLSSGTFTPQTSLNCDYLVLAGGAGGGRYGGGGGGAGGMRCTVTATGGGGSLETPLAVAPGVGLTVTVGAGGAGSIDTAGNCFGYNGSNSVFSTITSAGGGGGGGGYGATIVSGRSGGSGGGTSFEVATAGGTASPSGQGFAGGARGTNEGGGGGGAGAVGSNTTGNGGNGVATSISGLSVTYGGGGGSGGNVNPAGSGGTGGGGAGGYSTFPTQGTANLGGGGGGGYADNGGYVNNNGAQGGSGVVIIRYLA
jgi:hypothetical protein